jgi:hypothetical protein
MPKRNDLKSICIIGAGPIVIGQACEFDYSGAQACKALREEGYRVVLINSNPATIMTDPDMADATYIEPITPEIVTKILEKEKPEAVLPTMGGQTALNTALALDADGTLERLGIELIGAKADVIDRAEDRQKFRDCMDELGLESPRSVAVHSIDEAFKALDCLPLCAHHLPCVGLVAALPITGKNLKTLFARVWTLHQSTKFWSKNPFWDGKNMKWRLSATKPIIALLFVQLKILTQWVFIQVIPLRLRPP